MQRIEFDQRRELGPFSAAKHGSAALTVPEGALLAPSSGEKQRYHWLLASTLRALISQVLLGADPGPPMHCLKGPHT